MLQICRGTSKPMSLLWSDPLWEIWGDTENSQNCFHLGSKLRSVTYISYAVLTGGLRNSSRLEFALVMSSWRCCCGSATLLRYWCTRAVSLLKYGGAIRLSSSNQYVESAWWIPWYTARCSTVVCQVCEYVCCLVKLVKLILRHCRRELGQSILKSCCCAVAPEVLPYSFWMI